MYICAENRGQKVEYLTKNTFNVKKLDLFFNHYKVKMLTIIGFERTVLIVR